MDALVLFKNDMRLFAAELQKSSVTSFSLDWIGNAKREFDVSLTRVDDLGVRAWNLGPLIVGDKVSFMTTDVEETDVPTALVSPSNLGGSENKTRAPIASKDPKMSGENIGHMHCMINNRTVHSVCLSTESVFLISFVWLGDKSGSSKMHMSNGSSSIRVPKIRFGDEVAIVSIPASNSASGLDRG